MANETRASVCGPALHVFTKGFRAPARGGVDVAFRGLFVGHVPHRTRGQRHARSLRGELGNVRGKRVRRPSHGRARGFVQRDLVPRTGRVSLFRIAVRPAVVHNDSAVAPEFTETRRRRVE